MLAKTVFIDDFPTTEATVYTVPANHVAKWVTMFVSNSNGSSISGVAVKLLRGATTYPLIGSKSLAASEVLLLGSNNYIMLQGGDQIRIVAGSAGVSAAFTFELSPASVALNG